MSESAILFAASSGRQISVSGTSDRAAIPNVAFYDTLYAITGGTAVRVRLGDSSVTAAALSGGVGDPLLPANAAVKISIPRDATHIAAITDSGTSTLDFFPYVARKEGGGA